MIGMVLVASRSRADRPETSRHDNDINFKRSPARQQVREAEPYCPPRFGTVSKCSVLRHSQVLAGPAESPGAGWSREPSVEWLEYPIRETFARLLRLGWKAKRKEHGAEDEANDLFSHEFSPAFLLLTAYCFSLTVT